MKMVGNTRLRLRNNSRGMAHPGGIHLFADELGFENE